MDFKFENGVLNITLPQRIAAENSPVFEQELFALEEIDAAKEIILDADALIYISSFGLRVILKLRKKYKKTPLSVLNVSEDVYNIFEATGFTSLLNVKKKLRYVDTSALEIIGSGMYGSVYRVNEEQILKVFHGTQSEEDIAPVINAIRVAFVHDLPTIIPFEIVRTEKGIGMILELIHSETLSKLIEKSSEENPQDLDKYIEAMLELSKKLAATNFEAGSLRSRNDTLKSKLEGATGFLAPDEILTIRNCIDAIPKRNTAVHGDFHAKNLMMSGGSLMLIDMDEFSLGHPIWDIANFYFIYQTMVYMDREVAHDMFDLDKNLAYEDFYFKIIGCRFNQAEIIWNKFFNGYFSDYSEEDKEKILKLIKFYANFKFITYLIDIFGQVKYNPDILAKKVKNMRYFLSKLKSENLDDLIKHLELWK